MLELGLGGARHRPSVFLFFGAHCDDIEIGCGGTILELAERYPDGRFIWIVFSSNEERAREVRNSFSFFLEDVKKKQLIVQRFRNGYFPYDGSLIKDFFESIKSTINPDVIFTHYREDLHQDHRIISELTWNTYRDHMILEYEIPKYDGGLASPNCFFPIAEKQYLKKVTILLDCFPSESGKRWFSKDTFLGMMRLRGIECNSSSGHAEAFYCRKAVISDS